MNRKEVELPKRSLSYNAPQLSFKLQQSKYNVLNWARGVGKSTVTGDKVGTAMHPKYGMPRGKMAMVGQTLVQLLTRTLPSLISGLEMLGIYRDTHYVIGKRPPASWPISYQPPLSYDQTISTCTGLCVQLVSLEGTSARGINVDEIVAEEGLTLNKEIFDSTISIANRGNLGKFPKYPFHHAVTVVTSMPLSLSGSWILDAGNYYKALMYREKRNALVELIIELLDTFEENIERRAKLWAEIIKLKKELVYFASEEGTYYSEADILDNLINLGWDYVLQQRKSLLDHVFRVELLGQLIMLQGNRFYPYLSDSNLYDPSDYNKLLGLEYDFSKLQNLKSLGDRSVLRHKALDIACDYGGKINCIVAGQEQASGKEYTINSAFYRKHPALISDVVDDFCKYFIDHGRKVVNYYYDHTALGTDGRSRLSYKDMVVQAFRANKWEVIEKFIGHTMDPEKRYTFFCKVFRNQEPKIPMILFNRETAYYAYNSMVNAGIKETHKGFKKDKDAEKKETIDQEKTTHLSDAVDTLISGKYSSRVVSGGGQFVSNLWV